MKRQMLAVMVLAATVDGTEPVTRLTPEVRFPESEEPLAFAPAKVCDIAFDRLVDQPSEVLFLPDERLVVVNIDAPSPGMVNSRPDAVHTLGVVDLRANRRFFCYNHLQSISEKGFRDGQQKVVPVG